MGPLMVYNKLLKNFSFFNYLEMLVFLIYCLFYHVCGAWGSVVVKALRY